MDLGSLLLQINPEVPMAMGWVLGGAATGGGVLAFYTAALWQVFRKAGQPGWAALVPFYNLVVLLRVAGKPLWWLFLLFVPFVNIAIIYMILVSVALNFGRDPGVAVGLSLFNFVFFPYLGFSDARFVGQVLGRTPLFPTPHERQLAHRYLYRSRRSKAVLAVTVLLFLLAAAAVLSYFLLPAERTPISGALAILMPLIFLGFSLLNFFSVFSTVAVVGVMLGVAALTVVMAVTSGFQAEIRNRVIGVNAHILVLKYGTDFHEYEETIRKLQEAGSGIGVVAASPFVFNEMLIAREGGTSAGVLVKGIDIKRSPRVLDLEEHLLPGADGQRPPLGALQLSQSPSEGGPPLPGAFIGRELAHKLKVKIGDRLRLIAPLIGLDGGLGEGNGPDSPPGGAGVPPRSLEFRLAGVFVAGFDEYDRRLVYVELGRAQELAGQGDVVTGVEMRVRDAERARKVAGQLEDLLGGAPYRTLDWEELNRNLFTALALQKAVLSLVLFLIVLVAAFNIVASLTMMVIDKTKEVAILKAMGISAGSVDSVFRAAGMTIGISGTALGIFMGALVCTVVARLGYLLDAKVYLIDRLPIKVAPWEVLGTAGSTLVICFIATIYPSLRAACLPPVDGLRYE